MSRFSPAHRPGFAARTGLPDPKMLRREWVAAISAAAMATAPDGLDGMSESLASAVGQALSRNEQRELLCVYLRRLKADNFPIEAFSARAMAAAFLSLAGAFSNAATGPEARTACAPFLHAGARALDGLLNDLRDAEAATWRGRTGERED